MSQIYVPLHNHTHGSTLDGFATEVELAQIAKEIGAKAAAITDHGTCTRHFTFDTAARQNGIKAIFGTEAYIVDDVALSRERKDKPSDFSHACIWAINNKGLENLWSLSTISYDTDHFYHKPRMDFELLKKYSEGLAISDGCLLAEVAKAINADDIERAIRYLTTMIDIFGKDNVFIELHTWQFINPIDDNQKRLNAEMTKANQGKLELAKKLGLKTVAVNDAHYCWREDHVYHELVWAGLKNRGGDALSDIISEDGTSLGRGETAAWVMTDDEIREYLGRHGIPASDIEDAIQNTSDFADRVTATIDAKPKFPFITGDRDKDLEVFEKTVEEGFLRKTPRGKEEEYRARLETEKEVIIAKNFHGYFNIVSDYTKFAKEPDTMGIKGGIPGKEEVFVGAGRGSGAASLVAYYMDITEIDPIRHDLPFERFLSMSRGVEHGDRLFFDDGSVGNVKETEEKYHLKIGDDYGDGRIITGKQESFVGDFPDIDSDFPSSFAGKLIDYLRHRYGEMNVAKVGTDQTSQAKNVFKDLARAYDIPYREANEISSLFPPDIGPQYFEDLDALHMLYKEVPELEKHHLLMQKVAPNMKKMVGRIRQSGSHASGYIISTNSLLGQIPMRYKDGELITQFNLTDCSSMGFIKYDILKITALDIIDNAVRTAIDNKRVVRKEVDGKMMYYNINDVDLGDGYELVEKFTSDMIYSGATNQLDNPDIWEGTRNGDSLGLFQLETKGGERLAKSMQIMNVQDAAILSAVNRPGMMRAGLAGSFFKRRDGLEPVTYPHPMLEEVVGKTEGYFIFQEDVMRLFTNLANYSMEESDNVRKIITKKGFGLMDMLKRDFIKACGKNEEFIARLPEKYEKYEDCCEDIWSMVEHTVSYSFNSGHSFSYSYLTGWQAWLKTYFLPEFIKASVTNNPGKIKLYNSFASKHGIEFLRPDINKSKAGFEIEDNSIRTPLSQISHVGGKAIEEIFNSRPFYSISDFEEKTSGRNAKRINVYKNLVIAGAFDDIEPDRKALLDHVYSSKGKMREEGAGLVPDVDVDLSSKALIAKAEEDIMGLSFSFDPMLMIEDMLTSPAMSDELSIDEVDIGQGFAVFGKVITKRPHKSKNGTMAWVTLELKDMSMFEVTMFADLFTNVKHLFEEGDVLLISSKRSNDYSGRKSFIANEVVNMTQYLS